MPNALVKMSPLSRKSNLMYPRNAFSDLSNTVNLMMMKNFFFFKSKTTYKGKIAFLFPISYNIDCVYYCEAMPAIKCHHNCPQFAMTTGLLVFPLSLPTASIIFTTSFPSTTLPNTTCFPSKWLVFAVQMKNCEPLVFGPALAMERMPRLRMRR